MASGSRPAPSAAWRMTAELLRVLLRGDVGGQPAVGQPAGDAEHARAVGGEPDRRRRALVGLEADDRVLQVEELAVEGDRLVGRPQQPEDLDRLFQAADRLVPLDAVGRDVHALARAEPEDRAALREVVDGQRLLGEHRRVAVDRVRDADADLDRRRGRAGRAHHDQRVEVGVGAVLVLRQAGQLLRPHGVRRPAHQVPRPPDGVEAVGLGALGELDGLGGRGHDPARCAQGDSQLISHRARGAYQPTI